jgi:cytochrome c551/c552
MKTRIVAAFALFLPLTAAADDGEALFTSKGCVACHDAAEDRTAMGLGPSIAQVKAAYDAAGGAEALVKFLNADPEAKPLVKPELYPIMQGQQALTKTLTDDERKALADFLLK